MYAINEIDDSSSESEGLYSRRNRLLVAPSWIVRQVHTSDCMALTLSSVLDVLAIDTGYAN